MPDDCIFCQVAAGKTNTPLLYEDKDIVAFADNRPIAPKHVLVVPREHHPTLLDAMGSEDEALLGKLLRAAAKIAKEQFGGDGFRVVVNNGSSAGQTVYHLHLHLMSGRHFAWPPG